MTRQNAVSRVIILVLAVLCCFANERGTAARQSPQRDVPAAPQTGSSTIAGRIVVNDSSAPPVRQVILLLSGGGLANARQTTTDDEGRFVFSDLPAGRFTLQGWRNGFVRDYFGNKRPGIGTGLPIIVAEGERSDITWKMTRASVITGTVTMPIGGLAGSGGVMVQPFVVRTVAGERRLEPAPFGGGSGGMGSVDDRGVYRIYGLAPGEYTLAVANLAMTEARPVLPAEVRWAAAQFDPSRAQDAVAPPPPSVPVANATIYYPGTTDPAAAATFTVGPGEERSGIDLTVVALPVAKLEGTIVTPDGRPPQGVQVTAVPASREPTLMFGNRAPVRTMPDGRFTVTRVMPGRYQLVARASTGAAGGAPVAAPAVPLAGRGGVPAGPTLWGTLDVDVAGRDQSNLVINLQPMMTISGRIVFDGAAPSPPDLRTIRVSAAAFPTAALAMPQPSAGVNEDGTFTLGVMPGRYRVSAFLSAPAQTAWTLRSAIVDGRDVLDDPIPVGPGQNFSSAVLTYTDKPTEIAGTISDAGGRPATELFVVAFSADRKMWLQGSRRVISTRPATTGLYRFTALPAGDYYLTALTDVGPDVDLTDPAFLEQLIPSAIKLSLTEGEKRTQNLKVAR